MSHTQRELVGTLQEQKKWLEVQHRPELRVTEYDIRDTMPPAKEKFVPDVTNVDNGLRRKCKFDVMLEPGGRVRIWTD